MNRPPGSSGKELPFAPLWSRGFLLSTEQRQQCSHLILQLRRLVLFGGQLLGEGKSLPVLMRATCFWGEGLIDTWIFMGNFEILNRKEKDLRQR